MNPTHRAIDTRIRKLQRLLAGPRFPGRQHLVKQTTRELFQLWSRKETRS